MVQVQFICIAFCICALLHSVFVVHYFVVKKRYATGLSVDLFVCVHCFLHLRFTYSYVFLASGEIS